MIFGKLILRYPRGNVELLFGKKYRLRLAKIREVGNKLQRVISI